LQLFSLSIIVMSISEEFVLYASLLFFQAFIIKI
jgi:hypothetical protein